MTRLRKRSGAAISETGPALFILLIMVFFPMINILQIGAGYAIAQTYHDYTIREIACRDPSNAQDAIDKVRDEFGSSALFDFLKVRNFGLVGNPQFLGVDGAPMGIPPAGDPARRNIARVRISTRVEVSPFITVPFIPAVPGLSAPFPFLETTDRPQEELGLN